MQILEALELDGPATSTGLSARLGESTGTISWHLRLLAEHGYIEEEVDRGTKRERWWRVPPAGTVLNPADFRDDPETSGALKVYLEDLVERYYDRVRRYVAEDWSGEWQHAASLSDWRDLKLTPEQASGAQRRNCRPRHRALQGRRVTRLRTPMPVIVQLQSFPRRPRMSLLVRHRDFRWFWIGETVSRFGSSVSTVALPLIAVSVLQASTFEVGLLSAAAWLPWLLIGLPVGAWVDRWQRRPIMQLASAASLILFASIPLAAYAGLLTHRVAARQSQY